MNLLLFNEKPSNEVGIIKENTLLETTIGDNIRVYPRHYAHFGLPVRNLKESTRAGFAEIGESWWKRLSSDSRLKGIVQFELRYDLVDQLTDSCLPGNTKTTEKVPQHFFCKGFLALVGNVHYPSCVIPKIWNGDFDLHGIFGWRVICARCCDRS